LVYRTPKQASAPLSGKEPKNAEGKKERKRRKVAKKWADLLLIAADK
jgi:hypothetical protein